MRQTSDYAFDLPDEAIAQFPAHKRDGSRLLHLESEATHDRQFLDFVSIVPSDAILVVNDTQVIRARLRAQRQSGGLVELLAVEPTAVSRRWRCLAKASKPLRDGVELRLVGTDIECKIVGGRLQDGSVIVEFHDDVFEILEAHGELPLPPYIARPTGDTREDRDRYQTLFAKEYGAVAAPTAGLHFSESVLSALEQSGVTRASVTLHVGLGTFAPVRVNSLRDIVLHEERYFIPEQTAALIASGRPVVAVGTTVVRALESACVGPHTIRVGQGVTSLFISPGFEFRIVEHLLTNFHLPRSSLLMMVCAFAGYGRVMAAYRHAVANGYRFYSYGDAMYVSYQNDSGAPS